MKKYLRQIFLKKWYISADQIDEKNSLPLIHEKRFLDSEVASEGACKKG